MHSVLYRTQACMCQNRGLSDRARPNHTGNVAQCGQSSTESKFSLSNPGILKCHINGKLITWKGCARKKIWWLSVRVYASNAVQNSSLHAVELGIIQWSEAQSHRGSCQGNWCDDKYHVGLMHVVLYRTQARTHWNLGSSDGAQSHRGTYQGHGKFDINSVGFCQFLTA